MNIDFTSDEMTVTGNSNPGTSFENSSTSTHEILTTKPISGCKRTAAEYEGFSTDV